MEQQLLKQDVNMRRANLFLLKKCDLIQELSGVCLMANTHLTVQGTVSFVKHAVCAKVSIDRGSTERTGRAAAWQCF